MAAFQAMPRNPYHIRSTSLPSRQHPTALRVEEQLHQLMARETPPSSTHYKIQILHDSFDSLTVLYGCVKDLLQSPQTQNAIAQNRHGKWADKVLDGSLGMLDVCATMKDAFLQMKENLKDLQSTLRRRGAKEDFFYQVKSYMSSKKEMKKRLDKCFRSLKKMETRCNLSLLIDNDQYLPTVIKVLKEVRSITISIFESLLSLLSSSRATAKSSLVSKWMWSKRISCDSEVEKLNEMKRLDATLCAFSCKFSRDVDAELIQSSQKQLGAAFTSIQDLEDRLDFMYKSLIKTRVSLLNILNH